jgi:23S rRNA G2445 N2-methylase RlmL
MTALPKIGADAREEAGVHSVLRRTASDREKKSIARTLEKIGGAATLEITAGDDRFALGGTVQKVEANLARAQKTSVVALNQTLANVADLHIRLRSREGLERIVEDELYEKSRDHAKFRLVRSARGAVTIAPLSAFSLADIYEFRCFGTASILLGEIPASEANAESLAAIIASPLSQRVLEAFTEGPVRYRLEFVSRGHQRSLVRQVANRVYELCPRLLNDSRDAPWQIDIFHAAHGVSVELTPRLRPDPRFAYRRGDVPAASHPPLAACMARLAGRMENETIWDPFCGSGLELIETTRRGDVQRVIGTDRDAGAIAIAETNFTEAIKTPPSTIFACCDFRDHASIEGLKAGAVSLVITNPPLGRRVPIPNLHELIEDLFAAVAAVLKRGGRLVFVNPLSVKPAGNSLKLEFRQKVDLGGFNCHLEKYRKI